MTVLRIDRSLKKLTRSLLDAMDLPSDKFIRKAVSHYKDNGEPNRGSEYVKKITSASITWRTFLETLRIIVTDDTEVKVKVTQRLPTGTDTYGEVTETSMVLRDFEYNTNRLEPSELSLFLSKILEESGVNQAIYTNRVIRWMMEECPQYTTSQIRIKSGGFVKKVAGDNITWNTFLDALRALGGKDITFSIQIIYPDKTIDSQISLD